MRAAPLPALPDINGHLHGFALTWGGEEVAAFPTWDGATAGRRAAKDALAMLAACLASANAERGAA